MAGNTLGPRTLFRYFTDNADQGVYLTDRDLGLAVGATPAAGSDPRITLYGLRKRYVLCENADGSVKKRVVCPRIENDKFINGGTLTIDGETFIITGRVGESQTFGKGTAGGEGGSGGGGTGG